MTVGQTGRTAAGNPVGRPGDDHTLVVAGRYEIDLGTPLGSGGMAIVYRGRDLRTRRAVACRTLRTEYRTNPASRAAFRQETRNQALAVHGNIARIFDLHEEQEAPWAVMELVPGQTLRDLLTTHGPYPPPDAADLLDQVAAALAYLHGRGMVHLDVKPENLIVGPDGTVKLIDFGLAQPLGKVAEPIGGAAFGTAAYLSPEQITGDRVDAASDVYTLACVVYEVITGEPPFGAVPPGAPDAATARNIILRAHMDTAPAAPSQIRPDLEIPPALDDVVLWALAKRPNERYTDVTAFARLFRGAIEPFGGDMGQTTIPITYAPPSRPEPPAAPPPGHRPYLPPVDPAPVERVHWRDGVAPAPPVTRVPPSQPTGVPIGHRPQAMEAAWADAPAPALAPTADRQRSRRLGRRLRRLVARLILIAIVLGLVVLAVRIAVDGAAGTLPFQPRISRDAAVEIANDSGALTNVRSGAGTSNAVLVALPDGTDLTVSGDAARDGSGQLWWPVTSADDVTGYVRADGLRAIPDTWYERWSVSASDAIDGAIDPIRDAIPEF